MKPDAGHKATDKELEKLEKRLKKEYREASKSIEARLTEHMRGFIRKDAVKRQKLADGEIDQKEYDRWRYGQIATGDRWVALRNALAQDLRNADKIARAMVDGEKNDVFALNCNHAMYQIETGLGIDTSYTLYDHNSVERLIRKNPDVLPPMGKKVKQEIADKKAIAWHEGQIQSATAQAIMQGMSVDRFAGYIAQNLGSRNYSAAVRYARTAITEAQNAGRYEGYREATKKGIDLTLEWLATLDTRTRHSHREMHGQRRKVDEPFVIDDEAMGEVEILYPGYPEAPQDQIWNCRCTIASWIAGYEPDMVTESPGIKGMSFEEWQGTKQKVAATPTPAPDNVLLKTGEGYSDQEKQAIFDFIQNSDNIASQLYQGYVADLQPTINDKKRACFANADKRVYINRERVVAGDSLHPPYETHFHEYGHNIDYLAGQKHFGGIDFASRVFKVNGKNLGETINNEWLEKFSHDDKTIAKKIFEQQTKPGGMGAYGLVRQELNTWRQVNGISRDDNEYIKIRDAIDSAADDKALKKLYLKYKPVFGFTSQERNDYGFNRGAYDTFVRETTKAYPMRTRGNLSDMLEPFAVKHGRSDYPLGAGHGKRYASLPQKLSSEAFAEIMASELSNPESLDLIKKTLPKSYEVYKQLAKEILK